MIIVWMYVITISARVSSVIWCFGHIYFSWSKIYFEVITRSFSPFTTSDLLPPTFDLYSPVSKILFLQHKFGIDRVQLIGSHHSLTFADSAPMSIFSETLEELPASGGGKSMVSIFVEDRGSNITLS